MTKKEKKLKALKAKLSLYESMYFRRISDYGQDLSESFSSAINKEEAAILSCAIVDLEEEIEELENK